MRHFLAAIVSLWSISITYWATIYNFSSPEISKNLDNLNKTYNINTDIHILNPWDTCANRQDFSACIRDTYDNGVDLIFVINNQLRRMETSVRDNILTVIPKSKTLDFEETAVLSLQKWDTSLAITSFLNSLESFLNNTCKTYEINSCTVQDIKTWINLFEEQQKENRARQTVKYLQLVLWLLLTSLFVIWTWRRFTKRQRNTSNQKHVKQLIDHTNFLNLSVKHDTLLHKEDKESLQTSIHNFMSEIESLSSSSPDWIHLKLQEENYQKKLKDLTTIYQEKLELLGKSKKIISQLEKIKSINI